jgi:hypothetical protein
VEQKVELRSAQEIGNLGHQGSYLPSRPLAPGQVAVFEDARRGKRSHLAYRDSTYRSLFSLVKSRISSTAD